MGFFRYGVACSLNEVSVTAPITLRGSIEQICEDAKKIGYEGLEIQLATPLQFDWEHVKKVTEDYGLAITAFATGRELGENGLCLISDDAAVRRATIDRLKEHIDCAAVVGAKVIVGSLRAKLLGRPDAEKYEKYHQDAVLELADYAKTKNTEILIENILSYISDYLNTMAQVTDFVTGLGKDNVKVHLDTYSMMMEDNDISGSVAYCTKELDYVHFSDTARLYPGGGNVDFKTFMKALMQADYHGWIVTECVPLPTPYDCAKNGYEYMMAMETAARIELASKRF
ncbi:MAG: sugar phosphate isomerase/epimerase [Lachnospiraceae bacterium]|nr:sugar phosphate isomerase/epimerase [Lachnospiraceae bacterium]